MPKFFGQKSSRTLYTVAILALLLGLACQAFPLVSPVPHAQSRTLAATRGSELAASTVPSGDSMAYDGLDPIAVSLDWTETSCAFFGSYTVQDSSSGSNGPWTTLATITNCDSASLLDWGFTPGSTWWFQENDCDDIGGCTLSNQLQVQFEYSAVLSGNLATPTTVQLSWSNPAQAAGSYGGLLQFGSYQVMEEINGGPASSATTISSVGTTSYLASALSPGTSYTFYIVTTDEGNGVSASIPMDSNAVAITTPLPLTATAAASPTSATTGSSITFTCAASGGEAPYSYGWTFGDGTSGTGASTTHAYSSTGTFDATCTVSDSFGTEATSSASVTITSVGNGGGGNGPAGSGSGGSSSSPDYTTYYLVGGLIALVAVVAIVGFILKGRHKSPPTSPAASSTQNQKSWSPPPE
jgi:PKD repeat protein